MKQMTERRRNPQEAAQMRDQKPKKPPEAPKHLKAIAKGPADQTAALIFWKLRNQLPEFAVVLTEDDIKAFQDSMQYVEQSPKLIVDAHATKVIIRIADKVTGDMIRVEENNEAALDAKELAVKVRRAKEQAGNLVSTVRGEMAQGIFSDDTIRTLCDSLMLLARQ